MAHTTEKKLKIAVLMGGPSSEHEVSLSSGKQVSQNLDKNKYEVKNVVIPKSGKFSLPKNTDVAFIAMHGPFGEDGTIQGFLEAQGVKYTGSGILASALAMNKLKTLEIFEKYDMQTPKRIVFNQGEWRKNKVGSVTKIEKFLGFPLVVKPCRTGSSVGVSLVKTKNDLTTAINKSLKEDTLILLEEFIKGKEVTCGVLDEGSGQNAFALSPLEIVPKKAEFYDYTSKYASGGSDHFVPKIPTKVIKNIQDRALEAHNILGCSGMSRTDMIIRHGKVYVLETNTIPGMTPTSLLPQAAALAGISFPKLLDRIIKAAVNSD
ncbi:MAG: D-alanine--D-alanine ligase [bacterium]|nr:D-alanine--D-alanine ligase [bacterium]